MKINAVATLTQVKINPGVWYDRLKEGLVKTGKDAVVQFEKTTATWNTQVKFNIATRITRPRWEVTVYTDNDIYFFVNNGTEIRYAYMTEDFIPKTTPYFLGSNPGRGGVAGFNFYFPKPGIQARHFDEAVAEEVGPRFVDEMEKVMKEGFKEDFPHGTFTVKAGRI